MQAFDIIFPIPWVEVAGHTLVPCARRLAWSREFALTSLATRLWRVPVQEIALTITHSRAHGHFQNLTRLRDEPWIFCAYSKTIQHHCSRKNCRKAKINLALTHTCHSAGSSSRERSQAISRTLNASRELPGAIHVHSFTDVSPPPLGTPFF